MNAEWRNLFHDTTVYHLMDLEPFDHSPRRKPFRFEISWLNHPRLDLLVKEAWNLVDQTLPLVAHNFQHLVTMWNRKEFGNVHSKKRAIIARLKGI